MVVLPAASRPTIRIRISFLANSLLNNLVKDSPIFSRLPIYNNPKINSLIVNSHSLSNAIPHHCEKLDLNQLDLKHCTFLKKKES